MIQGAIHAQTEAKAKNPLTASLKEDAGENSVSVLENDSSLPPAV